MKIRSKASLLFDVLKVEFKLARIPLFVRWSITNKCSYRCLYCATWEQQVKELKLGQIKIILDDLTRNRTRWTSFTGGEPFLRDDLEGIINFAASKSMIVSINSSGFQVKEKKSVLKKINTLVLSLDGPKEIHNVIRQNSAAYDKVMEAVACAKEAGIEVRFTAVLSVQNFNCIDFMLEKARALDCPVMFQFSSPIKYRGCVNNPIVLSNAQRQQAIESLKELFKFGY